MAINMRLAVKACGIALLAVGGVWLAIAQTAPGQPAPAAPPAHPPAKDNGRDPSKDPPRSPLLKALYDGIDKLDDADNHDNHDNQFGDRDELRKSLRDADRILDRVRGENARALSEASRQPPTHRQPNIVLIVLDDIPRDHIGCYGQKSIQTPTLDRLAAHGTRFTQFRAGAGDAAARWALLTGRFVPAGELFALRRGEMTVAHALWRAAYATAWCGDLWLGDPQVAVSPAELGFEDWYGAHDPATPNYPEKLVRRGQFAEVPENARGERRLTVNELYTRQAATWIREFDASRAHRPFFVMVTYRVPGKDWESAEDDRYSQQNWSPSTKAWASLVTSVDREIANLVVALRDARQLNSTIIVVTADQRRAAVDDDKVFEVEGNQPQDATVAQSGVLVPLIVYGHGRVASGLVANAPATMADIPLTLTGLANYSKGSLNFGGHSLGDTLTSHAAATTATPVAPKVTDNVPETPAPAKPVRKLPQIIRGRP